MNEETDFRFGAEVYTWFMNNNGQTHQGRLGHMIEVIQKLDLRVYNQYISGWAGWVTPSYWKKN